VEGCARREQGIPGDLIEVVPVDAIDEALRPAMEDEGGKVLCGKKRNEPLRCVAALLLFGRHPLSSLGV